MSHFTMLKTRLMDQPSLLRALADLGYTEVEIHDSPRHLYGYLGDERNERAHIIVRRQHISQASNDIGFYRQAEGGFVAIISDYDRSKHNEAWLMRLTQRHAYHLVQAQLGEQGFTVIDEEHGSGDQIHLRLRRSQ